MNAAHALPAGLAQDYLERLRTALHPLPESEIDDIVREIHSHILERQALTGESDDAQVLRILDDLGSPEDIGALYQSEALVARARASFSPLRILASTARLASRSLLGLLAFCVAVFGYVFGAGWLLIALVKPFQRDRIGYWISAHRHSIGYLPNSEHAQEMLGWSIVPLAIVAGVVSITVTTWILHRLLRHVLAGRKKRWPMRQTGQSRTQ